MSSSNVTPIKRKPLPAQQPRPPSPEDASDVLASYFDDGDDDDTLGKDIGKLGLDDPPPMPPRPHTINVVSGPSQPSTASLKSSLTEPPDGSKSFWKKAVGETVYFAGGLISHPFESTKHFSILRHSTGLIYYKGPATRVAISIFSDAPLPSDRSLWLQRKGFSGNLGMNASVLMRTSANWIDVTPGQEALPSDVPPSDERAWQRDVKKFTKKASKHRHLSKQLLRETCLVRVPASAADGYLRIVLCTGEGRKKVLCPSPVFRIASTSTDVSILRGASLKTMPLEAALKVASVVGNAVVSSHIGTVTSAVQDKVSQYVQPTLIEQGVGMLAYSESGLQDKVDGVLQSDEASDEASDTPYDPMRPQEAFDSPPEVVGPDSGPSKPFPIRIDGKVMRGTGQGRSSNGNGIPTANLSGVAGDLLLRLDGIYIGWASVQPTKGLDDISYDWHEAIIMVGPSPYAAPRIVNKKVATVHIIHDFGSSTFFDAKLKVVVMAFLRPIPKPGGPKAQTDLAAAVAKDMEIALASLSRENWGPETTLNRIKTERSARSFADKMADTKTQVQKRVDSIPMHWAGIRTSAAEMRDGLHGNGGIYIRR
jgi:hypothetical protein